MFPGLFQVLVPVLIVVSGFLCFEFAFPVAIGGILFNYRLSFGIVTGMYAFSEKLIGIELLNVIFLIVALSSIVSVLLEKKLEREVCLIKG